jgi:molybdopterin-binding protein
MLEGVVKAVIRGSALTMIIIDEDAVAEVVSVIIEVIV